MRLSPCLLVAAALAASLLAEAPAAAAPRGAARFDRSAPAGRLRWGRVAPAVRVAARPPRPPRPPAPPNAGGKVGKAGRAVRAELGRRLKRAGETVRSPKRLVRAIGTTGVRVGVGVGVQILTGQPMVAGAASYVAGHLADRAADRLMPSTARPDKHDKMTRGQFVRHMAGGALVAGATAGLTNGLVSHLLPNAERTLRALPTAAAWLVQQVGARRVVQLATSAIVGGARRLLRLLLGRRGRLPGDDARGADPAPLASAERAPGPPARAAAATPRPEPPSPSGG